ncbi:hypothetical protein cyc_06713 [Cyclospora cayetanensis]|uniref:Uncharacterized protein n=1 Tax=Cyclospora cayetanensis TaxID=88456 RepID=A0A1D3CXY9_9EIME|nr:hypothetical protein cyc_06713 [Cyclospora cayetanensis]
MTQAVRSLDAQVWGIECDFSCSLCADGARLLMPVCVGDLQKEHAELAGVQEASGSRASVLKSPLVSSCRIAYVQGNNVNSSNTVVYVMAGEGVGCSMLSKKWVVQVEWGLDVGADKQPMCRRCCLVPLVPYTCGAGCYCTPAGVRASRRLRQDDAELAGGQEASGSRAPVLKSALVSSCRIACAQGNNVNSSNRMVYWHVEEEAAHCPQHVFYLDAHILSIAVDSQAFGRPGGFGRMMLSWQAVRKPVAVMHVGSWQHLASVLQCDA